MFIAQCAHDIATSYGLPISLFLAGLVGGFTHCAGMCSPFVLAQMNGQPILKKPSSALLLPYHLGRMTTYVSLAILLSSVINLAFVYSDLKTMIAAPMLVLAGVIFLVSAFPKLAALFPWAANIRLSGAYKLISHFSSKLLRDTSIANRYVLGILLGFMPCGLVVSALLASSTAANAWEAGLAMGAFTLGTIPALVLVALGGHALKARYPKFSTRATQGAMIISSLWLFALAGTMVF